MAGENGYQYSQEALRRVTGELRHGADALDRATEHDLISPDAGASSDVVGKALADLLKSAVAGAHGLAEMAENVHVTEGSYADVENTNEGVVRRSRQGGYAEQNMPLN